MKRKFDTKAIVITGLFLALEIVLQVIGNYLQIGPANINLSLVPVVLAALICGPISGAILGFFNGLMALLSPSTQGLFMVFNPWGTVIVCLLKCTLAAVLAAFVYDVIAKACKGEMRGRMFGVIAASIIVPVVNTLLFAIGALVFFQPLLEANETEQLKDIYSVLILGFIGFNFFIEIATTVIFTPSIAAILFKREEKSLVK